MKRKVWPHTFLFYLIFLILTSCSSSLLNQSDLHQSIIKTQNFNLLSFIDNHYSKHAIIYIEGDGVSWTNRTQISLDPTPHDPVALRLLLADQRKITKIYIARPCQYVKSPICNPYFWTNGRYDQKVIDSYHEALDKIKHTHYIQSFELISYSGGAAITALLAINRQDIIMLRCFAGNIDHQAWTDYHNISSLKGSINPMHYVSKLSKVWQVHYVGADDDNITPKLVKDYGDKINNTNLCQIHIIPNLDHYSNWDEFWKLSSKSQW